MHVSARIRLRTTKLTCQTHCVVWPRELCCLRPEASSGEYNM